VLVLDAKRLRNRPDELFTFVSGFGDDGGTLEIAIAMIIEMSHSAVATQLLAFLANNIIYLGAKQYELGRRLTRPRSCGRGAGLGLVLLHADLTFHHSYLLPPATTPLVSGMNSAVIQPRA
jgi:hypothetical protein